ncbi:MAG: hypothetical protein ACM3MD_10755 [Betaproteobacteria bacterium]
MPELVMVSNVEKMEKLKILLEELFKQERYSEIGQAIGMHSILFDPQHMMSDQASLYHFVLTMIKDRIHKTKGKSYSAWYAGFPKVLDQLVTANQIVTDKSAAEALASHRAAYGPFKSLDDFFSWALDDRRLPLSQIMKYVEKTATLSAC